jgi:hypothetical protein
LFDESYPFWVALFFCGVGGDCIRRLKPTAIICDNIKGASSLVEKHPIIIILSILTSCSDILHQKQPIYSYLNLYFEDLIKMLNLVGKEML